MLGKLQPDVSPNTLESGQINIAECIDVMAHVSLSMVLSQYHTCIFCHRIAVALNIELNRITLYCLAHSLLSEPQLSLFCHKIALHGTEIVFCYTLPSMHLCVPLSIPQ